MPLFRARRQERPADISLELPTSPTSSTAGHSGSSLKGTGGEQSAAMKPLAGSDEACTLLPTERAPLLNILEAYNQTRAAEWVRGPRAVAPALEHYVRATHYSSGDPLPQDLLKAVAMAHADRTMLGGANPLQMAVIAVASVFSGTIAAIATSGFALESDSCGLAFDLLWRWRWAAFPLLFAALSLAVVAVATFDRAPSSFTYYKRTLVHALYLLYCEDKCRQLAGLPEEVVHKVLLWAGDRYKVYTVHGDGHVSVHKRPPPTPPPPSED